MRILIVDDEDRARNMLEILLLDMGYTDIDTADCAEKALDCLQARSFGVVFLDIEMPGMNGLSLAERVSEFPSPPAVVFVTAYPEYSLRAWDVEAVDYILKPYGAEQIRRALERAVRRNSRPTPPRAEVRCFPDFALWVDGAPLNFGNKKARELLAYLVHMQGSWVSIDTVTFVLFEGRSEKNAKSYYRQILHRLKTVLHSAGVENMIQSAYGKVRVDPSAFTCDYYRYLKGETGLFFGEYLSEYSWAESTLGNLLGRD